jgi:hypothetical protein
MNMIELSTTAVTLSGTLQYLLNNGYQLADAGIAAMPPEAIQSDDWKLDKVHRFKAESQQAGQVLLIAVSSNLRNMRLLFVEVVTSPGEFSPINLVRRLFPSSLRKR